MKPFFTTFAFVKSMVSYLFPALLVCAYIATNMGFGVHTCGMDGSSTVKLLTGEALCSHEHDGGHDKHDDRCCHTLVYILDQVQEAISQINTKTNAPEVDLHTPFWTTSHLSGTLFGAVALTFDWVDLVRGPDGGTEAIVPLRL